MTARRALPFSHRATTLSLALLALAASTVPAAAQDVLVSNYAQLGTTAFQTSLDSFDLGQGFTTGSNTHGYTLTGVDLTFSGAPSNLTVKIATGLPSATEDFATLDNPETLTGGSVTFTAPANTTLSANTTYWVIIEGSGESLAISSDSEDPGGAEGWSIADGNVFRTASSTGAWTVGPVNRLIRVNGAAVEPPAAPAAPTVAQGPTSGSLEVSWTAPTSASAITDYDLRYFKGSADPTSESEWVTEGPGLPDPMTATTDTIKGLLAGTAYRVQVRAANADGEGPWSPSGSATTAAAPTTNRAPRVLEPKTGDATNSCQVKTDFTTPSKTINVIAGLSTPIAELVTRGSETTEWPTSCTGAADRAVPMFDDRDAEQLLITLDYTLPDNVRMEPGKPECEPARRAAIKGAGAGPLLSFGASPRFGGYGPFGVDITATDPHGASASTFVTLKMLLT